jgi:hypothetical protein
LHADAERQFLEQKLAELDDRTTRNEALPRAAANAGRS